MRAVFGLIFKEKDIDLHDLQSVLPENSKLKSENGKILLVVQTDKDKEENEYHVEILVKRELDRIFFATSYEIEYKLIDINGIKEKSINCGWKVLGDLKKLTIQKWNDPRLQIQLDLWRRAELATDLRMKAAYFYFIIELEHDEEFERYKRRRNESGSIIPVYCEDDLMAKRPPAPLTECYLIRNLCLHQGQINEEIKRYCRYLDISEGPIDLNDKNLLEKLETKVNSVLRKEARNIIDKKIAKISA